MITNIQTLSNSTLVSATEICRKKVNGVGRHVGLLLKFDNSTEQVLHTLPRKNIHLSTFKEFSAGLTVTTKECHIDTDGFINTKIKDLLAQPKQYSLFDNCEHLVSTIVKGTGRSPQLSKSIAGTSIGGAIGYGCSENKLVGTAAGMFLGLVIASL